MQNNQNESVTNAHIVALNMRRRNARHSARNVQSAINHTTLRLCAKPNRWDQTCTPLLMAIKTDRDYDAILTVDLEPTQQIHALTDAKFPKRIFPTLDVGRFQLDSGASCNVILADTLRSCLGQVKLYKTNSTIRQQ